MSKKYELTNITRNIYGSKLHQIKALRDIGDIAKEGDLGGWIQGEHNLSQDGDCWIGQKAYVFDNARVSNNAYVYNYARVYSYAWVVDNASVSDDAHVYGNAWIGKNARVYNNAQVYSDASVSHNAHVCHYAWIFGHALVGGDAWVGGHTSVYDNASVTGYASLYGYVRVFSNARISGNYHYIRGDFIGGGDTEKITDITDKTGSDYLKKQYVLGDFEIIKKEDKEIKKATFKVNNGINGVTFEVTDEQLEKIKSILDKE